VLGENISYPGFGLSSKEITLILVGIPFMLYRPVWDSCLLITVTSSFLDGNLQVHFQVASDVGVCDVLSSPWPMTAQCLRSRDKDGHHAWVHSRRSQDTRVHEYPAACTPGYLS